MELIVETALKTWEFYVDSALWLVFGLVAAGVLHGFVPAEFVANHLGRGKFIPVLKAALIGIPLPLCSCGVVPAAMGLRGKGASKGATVSFLVSTPETGEDTFAITWALMGPFMAIARPIAGILAALFAGSLESLFEGPGKGPRFEMAGAGAAGEELPQGAGSKLARGMHYAFGELLRDLTPWLLVGLLLGGAISALVPEGWINAEMGSGWLAKFAMLLLAVPVYVCATASTPIAAALVLKGLSPGAALIFLITGPATNTVAVVAMARMLGLGTTLRFLISITVSALFLGWLVDLFYGSSGLSAAPVGMGAGTQGEIAWLGIVGAAVLLVLIARAYLTGKGCGEECCR